MANIAFLFPGQGSQSVGMGKLLAEQYPQARHVFEEADEVLGFSISGLCFHGPEDELKKTEYTQPALLAVSTAAFCILALHGLEPALVAGHSLGEYSALVAAGALRFADAVRLVHQRGKFMQEAVPLGEGAMAAILKLPREAPLEPILAQAAEGQVVAAANYNSPDQIVIAGDTAAVHRAMDLCKAAGAKRAVLLAVSAPFHSPLMRPAQQNLAPLLRSVEFQDLSMPLINNWQAREISTAAEAREGLFEQIPNPVHWTASIRRITALGIDHVVEVGPGNVLGGLCRNIDPNLKTSKFGAPADLEKLLSELGPIAARSELVRNARA